MLRILKSRCEVSVPRLWNICVRSVWRLWGSKKSLCDVSVRSHVVPVYCLWVRSVLEVCLGSLWNWCDGLWWSLGKCQWEVSVWGLCCLCWECLRGLCCLCWEVSLWRVSLWCLCLCVRGLCWKVSVKYLSVGRCLCVSSLWERFPCEAFVCLSVGRCFCVRGPCVGLSIGLSAAYGRLRAASHGQRGLLLSVICFVSVLVSLWHFSWKEHEIYVQLCPLLELTSLCFWECPAAARLKVPALWHSLLSSWGPRAFPALSPTLSIGPGWAVTAALTLRVTLEKLLLFPWFLCLVGRGVGRSRLH